MVTISVSDERKPLIVRLAKKDRVKLERLAKQRGTKGQTAGAGLAEMIRVLIREAK